MKYLILVFVLVSCASKQTTNPIRVGKDEYEKVSVQTSLDLAFTSYLKACTEIMKENGKKNFFNHCKERAASHVKSNIIFILEQ
ncbi:MAG: hypothetical protein EP326_15820 [Deltaproteobacteria bacterium]|nr:MAG: hypothetical protein EP326_15820 [Deltaproteobacteria bacterium]TNF27467.1 MAG: hypothetical protein EP319_11525 [Deltaproteobacteria bacterium]